MNAVITENTKNKKRKRAFGRFFSTVGRFMARVRHVVRTIFGLRLDRSITGDFLTTAFLAIVAAFMAMPLVFIISNAFKPVNELFIFPPKFFVQNPTLSNFRDFTAIMENSWVPFARYIFNSAITTIVATAGHVVLASMAAYVLEKHRFPGRKPFFGLIVLSLMFSGSVLIVPTTQIMTSLRWIDTYFASILPYVGMPIGLFLMKQFITSVPDSLIESARIDGASELKVFWGIVMPSVKPAWLTAIIFCSQQAWNSASTASFIRAEQVKTLPQVLSRIVIEGGIARLGAGSVVSLLLVSVPVIIFILAQSNIIDTMTASGIKE